MNRTDAPKKQPVPFGTNGPRQDLLPTTPAGSNRASYDAGYPQVTMILKSAGGIPPEGQDMNQILFELSAIGRWLTAGALNAYDATFSSAVGGYPKASVLVGDDGSSIYISTVDANTNNPNSTSTGWLSLAKITAIAALSGGANKLPYFSGTNTAAQTDLTSVGRDIIGKSSIADILTYLGLGIRGLSTFTASGSWTCPEGVTTVYIDACGGGGGGAYSSPGATGGGGGGGAAAVIGTSISVTPGVTYTVTIGGPGAAGTPSSVNGVAGGATSFGSLLVLNGGGGGLSSAGAGAGGGTGGNAGTAGALNGGVSFGGSGGGCVLGNGGAGGSGAMFGTIPGQYGGGGGGGANGGSGARGAYGILKLRW